MQLRRKCGAIPSTPFVLLAFLLAACCTPCVHAWSVTIEDNTTALDFLNYTAEDNLYSSVNIRYDASIGADLLFEVLNSFVHLHGTLTIKDVPESVMPNMTRWSRTRSIQSIFIYSSYFTSFAGMENITITDLFGVIHCDNLVTFNGLGNAESVYKIYILYNDVLESFSGLELGNASRWWVEFYIVGHPKLVDISALDNAAGTVSRYGVWIENNYLLENATFIDGLVIEGGVDIRYNPSLRRVGTATFVPRSGSDPERLTTLVANPALEQFGGFHFHHEQTLSILAVVDCPLLPTVRMQGLRTRVGDRLSMMFARVPNTTLEMVDWALDEAPAVLHIEDTNLENLDGFNITGNTTSISRGLRIIHNRALTSIEGLRGVAAQGDEFISVALRNDIVENGDNVFTLADVAGVEIVGNPVLTSLSGLDTMQGPLYGRLRIADNAALVDASALSGITAVNSQFFVGVTPSWWWGWPSYLVGYVVIEDNPALVTLGLDSLQSVNGSFVLSNNTALRELHLCSLETINGDYNVTSNPDLYCGAVSDVLAAAGGGVSGETNIDTECVDSGCTGACCSVTLCAVSEDECLEGGPNNVRIDDGVGFFSTATIITLSSTAVLVCLLVVVVLLIKVCRKRRKNKVSGTALAMLAHKRDKRLQALVARDAIGWEEEVDSEIFDETDVNRRDVYRLSGTESVASGGDGGVVGSGGGDGVADDETSGSPNRHYAGEGLDICAPVVEDDEEDITGDYAM